MHSSFMSRMRIAFIPLMALMLVFGLASVTAAASPGAGISTPSFMTTTAGSTSPYYPPSDLANYYHSYSRVCAPPSKHDEAAWLGVPETALYWIFPCTWHEEGPSIRNGLRLKVDTIAWDTGCSLGPGSCRVYLGAGDSIGGMNAINIRYLYSKNDYVLKGAKVGKLFHPRLCSSADAAKIFGGNANDWFVPVEGGPYYLYSGSQVLHFATPAGVRVFLLDPTRSNGGTRLESGYYVVHGGSDGSGGPYGISVTAGTAANGCQS